MKFLCLPRVFKFLFVVSFAFSSAVFAGFEVMEGEENVDYGNAQNDTFRRAVSYEDTLDASDQKFLQSVEGKRVGNRWYYKFMLGRPDSKLKRVSNRTPGAVAGLQPATRNVKDDTYHISLVMGYKWVRWATEFELLFSEGLDYVTNPILFGQTIQLKADIQPIVLFWNIEYEIPTFFDFVPKRLHPYASIGPGIVLKTVDNQTLTTGGQGRQQKTHRSLDLGWQFSLGMKYQITNSFLVDINYRWIQLGDVEFGPIDFVPGSTNKYKLKSSDLETRGFTIGIVYQV